MSCCRHSGWRVCVGATRKGNCWDNACAESFFKTLKNELIGNTVYPDRKAAQKEIFEYIEMFYWERGLSRKPVTAFSRGRWCSVLRRPLDSLKNCAY
ncbi:MAG: IS3 family transposase [Spirochaetales bacterium]|nr:IS3 family transposase [Spirochaetales bacterium]MCF7939205.1 IS3 family transposase [Spirochaetales bacterium]